MTLARLLLALAIAGCASFTPSTTVNGILAEPGRFSGDDVWVSGRVVRSASMFGRGAYQLDDGTGKLWVISDEGVPRKDATVRVRGTVHDAYDLASVIQLPEAVSSGLVLMAKEHRAVAAPLPAPGPAGSAPPPDDQRM